MEVIVKNVKSHPCCPHGPTLMFERYTSEGQKSGRKFYACSACRGRAECNFFQWVDDQISAHRREHWKHIIDSCRPPFSHQECMTRLEQFKKLPAKQRLFCKNCSVLVLLGEEEEHSSHEMLYGIDWQLKKPTSILPPLENNKVEAQYLFTDKTVNFLVSLFKKLGFSRIVSIGTPRIHECILSKKNFGLSSLLLDIDFRYMQFYREEQFCHYNLFNNCFFGGPPAKKVLKNFVADDNGNGVLIVLDPPFGGLIDAISYTLVKLNDWWRKESKRDLSEEVPVMWFFPYFNESRIVQSMPSLKMMDYKVEYENHKKFGNKRKKQGLPVRFFTNVNPASIVLPADEGYKFCDTCQRYVFEGNKHCYSCNACTTKNGKTYKHCDKCKRCVKSSYEHCENCGICIHVQHICKEVAKIITCHLCSGVGHKQRDCPERINPSPRKKMKKA